MLPASRDVERRAASVGAGTSSFSIDKISEKPLERSKPKESASFQSAAFCETQPAL